MALGAGIRSIVRNGASLMGSNWIETALRAVYLVAITRYLGAELYGFWAYAMAAYGFLLGLTGFGLEVLLPIRLGRDRRDAAGILGVALSLRLGLLALAAVALAGYAVWGEPSGTARLAVLLVIPALCGRGVALWARTIFLGFERVGAYVRLAVTMRATEVALGVALLAAGSGLFPILALHSLVWVAEAVIGFRMVQIKLARCRPRLDADRAVELLREGAVLGLAALLTGWLLSGPLLLLRHVGGDLEIVGQFSLALQIAMILVASVQPFFATALPVLSRSHARDDPRVASYGRMTALAGLLLGATAATLGFAVGPPVMQFVFGSNFALAGELVGPCLLIGGLVLAPTGYMQVLIVRGWRWPGVLASGTGGLLLLFALPPAVAEWGAHGAVYATAASWLVRVAVLTLCAMTLSRVPANVAR